MTDEMSQTSSPNQSGKSPSGKKMGRPRKWRKIPIDQPTSVPSESPGIEPEGGLDAALSAAGEAPLSPITTTTPSQPPEGVASSSPQVLPPAGAPRPGATPEDCEALVNFADMIGTMSCRSYALIRKVPFDSELQRACMLSATERKQLMMMAPSAAPYVMELLKNAGVIGAGLFGIAYVFMLITKFGIIKDKANILDAEKERAEKEAELKEKKK